MSLQGSSRNDPITDLTFPFCGLYMLEFIIHTSHNKLLTRDYKQWRQRPKQTVVLMWRFSRWMRKKHTKIIFLASILWNGRKIKPTSEQVDYCKYFRISEEMQWGQALELAPSMLLRIIIVSGGDASKLYRLYSTSVLDCSANCTSNCFPKAEDLFGVAYKLRNQTYEIGVHREAFL